MLVFEFISILLLIGCLFEIVENFRDSRMEVTQLTQHVLFIIINFIIILIYSVCSIFVPL